MANIKNQSATYSNSTPVGIPGNGYLHNTTTATTWASINTNEIKPDTIQVNGDAVFNGNITWQDRDMREWFESVEARLAILNPNPKLEQEWSELAELRMRYVELERRLLEKQRVFDILKKS